MRIPSLPAALLAALLLAACGGNPPAGHEATVAPGVPASTAVDGNVVVGADEDAHGCKASAGFAWCPKTGQCERPWELAEREGFANTPEAYEGFCAAPEQALQQP